MYLVEESHVDRTIELLNKIAQLAILYSIPGTHISVRDKELIYLGLTAANCAEWLEDSKRGYQPKGADDGARG